MTKTRVTGRNAGETKKGGGRKSGDGRRLARLTEGRQDQLDAWGGQLNSGGRKQARKPLTASSGGSKVCCGGVHRSGAHC